MDARRFIIEKVRAAGGISAVADRAGISASMLYQFARPDGPWLGRDTVAALRAAGIRAYPQVWLAAMGVGSVPVFVKADREVES